MKPKANKLIYPALVVLIFALGLFSSCGQNRLKTDEKSLTKQILTEEEQLAHEAKLRAECEKQLADSIAKLPRGFQFQEERGIDPERPPMIIDIANSLDNIKDLKLSDVATDIKYIRLEAVPDPNLPRNMKYKYYTMDNYIVAANLYGIHLFSKEGQYIRTVVINELTGVEYDEKNDYLRFWNDYKLVGGGTSVWARGNSLFYTYSNNITGQQYIMEYDCTEDQPLSDSGFNPENTTRITGLGKVLIDMNHGNTTPPAPRKHQGMFSMNLDYFYFRMGAFSPDRNSYIKKMTGNNMMGIMYTQGDTLALFSKFEQIMNYTKSMMRSTDYGAQYQKNGCYFFRSDFNDTIFQVIPPNRLLPVYVLNLGNYKVSKQEGVDPGFDLTGKIIPLEFADTKKYLFLSFSKDSYDCPNTRKNKSLKYYQAVYSKEKGELQIINNDPTHYDAPVLENNIDGGLPVWPQSYKIGSRGEILISLKGTELKNHLKSALFKNATAPENQKDKLSQFANSVNDEDDLLMIVK